MHSHTNAAAKTVEPNRPGTLRWERTLFRGGTAEDICPPVIDLTGPARLVAFGPWRPLEPGLWRAIVSLDLCAEAARRRLRVELGSLPDYAATEVPRGVPGRHEVEVSAPLRAGNFAEVRICLMAPAFHGDLRFLGVELERLGDLPDEATSDAAQSTARQAAP